MLKARDITIIAIMTAILCVTQLLLSMVAGVELVTLLFFVFCKNFGAKRGLLVAIAFSLLRCMLFGAVLNVIILYLIYFPLVAIFIGNFKDSKICKFPYIIVVAIIFTALFTMIDNLISPIIYGSKFLPYLMASLPVMVSHIISVGTSFLLLFLIVDKAFLAISKQTT